jgi:PTH1 family peptidyl-tRNA hydrolase
MIVGLGNPGARYVQTRHNAGFLALDFFAGEHGLGLNSEKWQGEFWRGRLHGERVLLLKPQTYMNRSGECVGRFADYYRIAPADILVVHDDLDLLPGRVKVVARGGAGGHNGIRSIISHLGTPEFPRVKLGIGRPARNDSGQGVPVERFVLSRYPDSEWDLLTDQLAVAAEAMDLWLAEGVDRCMNRINTRRRDD